MRHFELSDGKSNKFWQVEVAGTSLTVTFGKIGTAGQTQITDAERTGQSLELRGRAPVGFGELPPIVFSELVRDLEDLRP